MWNKKGGLLLPLLLLLLVSVPGNEVAAQVSANAQRVLDSLRRTHQLPALLAAVIEPGGIRYVHSGVRRAGYPEQVALTDYFHLGSNTKGVTSFMAARLVAQGKLLWNSKLLDVVPELRAGALPAYAAVTLGDLLSHRAGIRPYNSGAEIQALPLWTGSVARKRQLFGRFVLRQSPVAAPAGQLYAYSNAGYALAALMLERASGRPWERLVASTFRQLKWTYKLSFPNQHDARQPWGHWLAQPADSTFQALEPTHPYRLPDFLAPAGDLAMPLPDYARFVQLHLNGLLGQENHLTTAAYQLLHFGRPAYAYGWGVSQLAGSNAPVSSHNGTAGTFFCHTILFPSQRVAFVVLTNAGGPPAEKACNELRRQLKKLWLQGLL